MDSRVYFIAENTVRHPNSPFEPCIENSSTTLTITDQFFPESLENLLGSNEVATKRTLTSGRKLYGACFLNRSTTEIT